MLKIEQIDAGYGEVAVLRDVSLSVAPNETVAIIGANGAGKSTLVAVVCGLLRPRAGRVWLRGTDISAMPAHHRVRMGIATVLERRHLFGEMSIRQHLQLTSALSRHRHKHAGHYDIDGIVDMFPFIGARMDDPVELLSGGEQQMVALGRALLLQPELLVLDEPSTGLAPLMVKEIMSAVGKLRKQGMSIVLVEQSVALAAQVADRAYVLSLGSVVHEVRPGEWSEFLDDQRLKTAYLGA
jgi:ABC-type branched-subunit amino acid transport system ATPase component